MGVIAELVGNTKTDRTAEVARDVAMHIAAAEPRFIGREDVTEKDLATEREIARDQAVKSGKPDNIVEKMVTGKMEKFYGEACLLGQPYIPKHKQNVREDLTTSHNHRRCAY